MHRRHALALLLPTVLVLTGCAAGSDPGERLAAVSADAPAGETSLAQDLRPLHAEAVELARAVQAATAEADVEAVAARIEAGQSALLAQVDDQLAQAGRAPGEVAALTQVELDALRGAVGDEAVELGLAGLLRNHLAALNRAKAAATEGVDGALADRVLDEQGAALQELTALG
jgi:uncharacterized protein (DUF305 family)